MSLKRNSEITKKVSRDVILEVEDAIKNIEGSFIGDNESCPLTHKFSDEMYVREIFIPKGMLIVGKIHKHSHPNFLLKGIVDVVTEDGAERLKAPLSIISPAGTKRALRAVTDLVWVTVHSNPTNTQDLNKLEDFIIAKDYKEYDNFAIKKRGLVRKLKNKIIKYLL